MTSAERSGRSGACARREQRRRRRGAVRARARAARSTPSATPARKRSTSVWPRSRGASGARTRPSGRTRASRAGGSANGGSQRCASGERLERRREGDSEGAATRTPGDALQRERMEHARIERERAARARADREKLERGSAPGARPSWSRSTSTSDAQGAGAAEGEAEGNGCAPPQGRGRSGQQAAPATAAEPLPPAPSPGTRLADRPGRRWRWRRSPPSPACSGRPSGCRYRCSAGRAARSPPR